MKLQDFLLGVATGIATAYVIKEVSEKVNPYKNANAVLENIKNAFKIHVGHFQVCGIEVR